MIFFDIHFFATDVIPGLTGNPVLLCFRSGITVTQTTCCSVAPNWTSVPSVNTIARLLQQPFMPEEVRTFLTVFPAQSVEE
jgi:hypothetical protein